MTKKPIVVGVTGGSGSGKTSVTKAICDHFSGHSILMIAQDVYYHDQANISFEDRLKVNYDHPLAFDTDLLISHIAALRRYETIEKPIYDYAKYTRKKRSRNPRT